jgi:hypothetical protein
MSIKEKIRGRIIEIEKQELAGLQQMLRTYSEAADIDEDATHDPEDFSHQNQNFESADNLTKRVSQVKAALDSFLNLPAGKMNQIEPGALAMTDKLNFYIGISTKQFEDGGKTFVGLNTDAPIYKALENKKAGDTVEFNGKKYKVKEIL